MNNYTNKYYLVCLKTNDDHDIEFTSKKKALEYVKEIKKLGIVELHTYRGDKNDTRAVYVKSEIVGEK